MKMIKRVYRNSAFVLVILAAASAFFEWKRLPASILIGGLLALVNLKGLSWGVESLIGSYKATARLVFFSMLRLAMLVFIVAVLLWLKLINVIGIFIGLTVVFTVIMIEGLRASAEENKGANG